MFTKRFDVPLTNSDSHLRSLTFKIHIFECTVQKMKFSIMDFFSKCDQIRSFLWIWSHVLKISLMENFISCALIHMIGLLSTTMVHTRFNYCCYYFKLAILNLVFSFIDWFYHVTFPFCRYISSQPTSICSKLVLLPGTLLATL